jgi:capsular polysaccharide biosynthesis protein
MPAFRKIKPHYYPLQGFKDLGRYREGLDRRTFLASDKTALYRVDQGHLIENPKTMCESPLPVYGNNIPENVISRQPFRSLNLYAILFRYSFINPAWGVVLTSDYELFEPSASMARWKSPDLRQIPGISINNGISQIDSSSLPKKVIRGTYLVLNHWGGRNYGHFLLDSLPGVLLFYKEILQGTIKIVTEPLQCWQREYLDILGIADSHLFLVAKDMFLKLESIVWPSTLYGNTHRPSYFTRVMGNFLTALSCIKESSANSELVYISRAGIKDRQFARKMENEEVLISALTQQGFTIIFPEQLSVAEQIEIFSQAKVIVGESGAGMANIIFASPGCNIIEIMPEIKNQVWIKQLCGLFGFSWFCIYSLVPPEKRTITTIQGVPYDDLAFNYDVNVSHVIQAVNRAKAKINKTSTN